MRAQPVLIQFESEPRPFRNGKDALSNRRLLPLRHLFLVAAERAERILDLEKVLNGRAYMHRRIETDQRTRPAVHSHWCARKGRVIGCLATPGDSARIRDIRM